MENARLFESAATYYRKFRPGYPPAVFDFLFDFLRLEPGLAALDLGCGTGQIALELAKRGLVVFAMDPDTEMLVEGVREEAAREQKGIRWCLGSDQTLAKARLPSQSVCTMGASFHWMNRSCVLEVLNDFIVDNGAVAIISGGTSAWSGPDTGWRPVVRRVIARFFGLGRRAGSGTYAHPEKRHEVVLAESCFGAVTQKKLAHTEQLDVESIIGLQLSTSYASPAQFGAQLDEFREALRNELLAVDPSGVFTIETQIEVLVAKRG